MEMNYTQIKKEKKQEDNKGTHFGRLDETT
jgi:hypothetical protein